MKFEGECYNCGKKGHRAADCWQEAAEEGAKGGGKKFKGECHNCDKKCHRAADCWQKQAAEAGAKSKGGKGGKGKGQGGKGKGINSWEQEEWPEWAPALCGLEVVEKAFLDLSLLESGWTACNFDTGAAVTALPKGAEAKPDGSSYRTASGEFVGGYGPGTIVGKDELGRWRTIDGELADVHKVLISASATHAKGHFTWLEKGGGYIIPERSDLGKDLRRAFDAAVKKHDLVDLIPVYEEGGVCNFYLKNQKQKPEKKEEQKKTDNATKPTAIDVSAVGSSASTDADPAEVVENLEQLEYGHYPKCLLCETYGHIARDCRRWLDEQPEPQPPGIKHEELEDQMLLRSDEIEGAASTEAAAGADGWQTVFRRHAGRR